MSTHRRRRRGRHRRPPAWRLRLVSGLATLTVLAILLILAPTTTADWQPARPVPVTPTPHAGAAIPAFLVADPAPAVPATSSTATPPSSTVPATPVATAAPTTSAASTPPSTTEAPAPTTRPRPRPTSTPAPAPVTTPSPTRAPSCAA